MRIVSLVPNATEILFALGAGELVVGVSHECDYPPEAIGLPQLTASALAPMLTTSEVDQAVSSQLAGGESLYTLDDERIASLEPSLIVTQTLCPVCAVSTSQVGAAIEPLQKCPEVVSLDPKTLDDVFEDIRRLGEALDRRRQATELIASLRSRIETVQEKVTGRPRPRVAALEWLDPPFLAGHWIPEMIDLAGGTDAFASSGGASQRTDWDRIAAVDPDILIAMPCGFDLAGSRAQLVELAAHPEWSALRGVREGRVHAVDANGCFSRPGPRLVDGLETLADCFHGSL